VAGTVLTAAILAFFGYVLEILVEVYEQVSMYASRRSEGGGRTLTLTM
jgi:hypothetical protein